MAKGQEGKMESGQESEPGGPGTLKCRVVEPSEQRQESCLTTYTVNFPYCETAAEQPFPRSPAILRTRDPLVLYEREYVCLCIHIPQPSEGGPALLVPDFCLTKTR